MNPARIASNDWKSLKCYGLSPDFFYIFYRILSFSTVSQSFKKICVWEVFGRERP